MSEARRGFFPIVTGDQVSVKQAGGLAFVARSSLQLTQGGGQLIGAGNSLSVTQGGSWVMGAGGSVNIDQGGAGVLVAKDIRAERSFVGIAVGGKVTIEDSRILLGSGTALAIGAALGLIGGWLLSRRD